MTIYKNKKNNPKNKHKDVRSNLDLNKGIGIIFKSEFTIGSNEDWASDIISQHSEYKTIGQTTAILFPKVPGLMMKWWEN